MTEPVSSPYLVPDDGSFRVADAATEPPDDAPGKKRCRKQLEDRIDEMRDLQRMLYATTITPSCWFSRRWTRQARTAPFAR